MSQDLVLEQIFEKPIAEFHPKPIYLFGSRATGHFRPDSDYDLLLVVQTSDRERLARIDQARAALKGVEGRLTKRSPNPGSVRPAKISDWRSSWPTFNRH